MTTEFKLPELGENIEAGDVVDILVSVGDKVEQDQPVLELETDKATIEVPSGVSGVVTEIHVEVGGQARVGEPVLTVEGDAAAESGNAEPETVEQSAQEPEPVAAGKAAEETAEAPQQTQPESGGEPQLVEFKLPELGENIEGGDVISVLVSVGDIVEENQPIVELETDKATIEVPSGVSGTVKEIFVEEGGQARVGEPVLAVETTASVPVEPASTAPVAESGPPPGGETRDEPPSETEKWPASREVDPAVIPQQDRSVVPAAPNLRRLAREIGVDITQVEGTGPGGRISMDDVKRQARQRLTGSAGPVAVTGSGVPAEPLPDFSRFGPLRREPMSNVRRKTAEHLSHAWTTIPHVTQFDRADIEELEQLRKRFAQKAADAGGKLTITAILIKVVGAALKAFPQFNASVDMENREIIYKDYYNVGLAVDTERGLLVPVIRDVDRKNIIDLAVELGEISEKARNRKLSLEEMQGGNFSITNLGGIGGTNFTPVVNWPEVAILGVARGRREPVFRDGEFEPRLMLPLALSYDHRLIDGADAARFLRWIVGALEDPVAMSLQAW
jgi:pyruvate dehydrogenase E2 component (dihydrolipoamide acetyltransferase)